MNEKMYQYYLLYHTVLRIVAKEKAPWSVHDLTPAMTEKVLQAPGRWSDLQKEGKRPLKNIVTEGILACSFHEIKQRGMFFPPLPPSNHPACNANPVPALHSPFPI